MSDKNLYFPPRLFEVDITMRYVKWWKQSVLGDGDSDKKIVKRKRSVSSRKRKTRVGKANKSGIHAGGQPGFRPHLEDTPAFRIFFLMFLLKILHMIVRKLKKILMLLPYLLGILTCERVKQCNS